MKVMCELSSLEWNTYGYVNMKRAPFLDFKCGLPPSLNCIRNLTEHLGNSNIHKDSVNILAGTWFTKTYDGKAIYSKHLLTRIK